MEQFFIIKQNVKLNCEHSPNAESGSDKKGAHKLIARTNRPFEKGIRQKKHNITFNKNKEPYLIQAQNISYNTKDDPSTEKFSSNSNFVIAIVYQTTVMILITLTL